MGSRPMGPGVRRRAYTFAVTPPGQSAISYTWDDNGSLLSRGSDAFEWDFEERMVEATVNSATSGSR